MTIINLASKYRLRVHRDGCGDVVVVGKLGELYQHDDGMVGLILMSPNGDDPKLDNTLRARRRKALREGLELQQRGDYESTFVFDCENRAQAQLAIRLVGIKRRRHQGGKGKPLNSERARYLAQIRLNNAREGREKDKSRGISPQAEELVEMTV